MITNGILWRLYKGVKFEHIDSDKESTEHGRKGMVIVGYRGLHSK